MKEMTPTTPSRPKPANGLPGQRKLPRRVSACKAQGRGAVFIGANLQVTRTAGQDSLARRRVGR